MAQVHFEKRAKTLYLIIHHTEGNRFKQTVKEIEAFHKAAPPKGRGWLACGYQRIIRGDGTVCETDRPIWSVGAHCPSRNRDSIGISLTGNFLKDKLSLLKDKDGNFIDPQAGALIWVLVKYCKEYDIPVENICGHQDFFPTECPASIQKQLPEIRKLVGAYL